MEVLKEMWRETGRFSSSGLSLAALVSFFLIVLFLPQSTGLQCVTCTSLKDSGCFEGRGKNQTCKETENYCVSYIGYLKRGQAQVLFRTCSETNMSHFCDVHFEKLSNDRVERLTACYRTCDTDFCNTHRMEYLSNAPATAFGLPPLATVSVAAILTLLTKGIIGT
ncbi:U-scoloptoxin(05)-Er1a-like [Penaeus vannamei]|uniref:U-scoloptoxin(05)-Er1a-like n=1 Tax=Penaeus vannamei TaxID=6689 RepID=UPI00387F6DF8